MTRFSPPLGFDVRDGVEKGDFWKFTSFDFNTLAEYLRPRMNFDYYVTGTGYGQKTLTLSYINDKYIRGDIRDCIQFVISRDRYTEKQLRNLTTKCKIKNVKTKQLMLLMDTIAMLFNISRIYLQDDAHTLDYDGKIDLTLLTVMRDNKTFYEKYGYESCYNFSDKNRTPRIDLELHKKLLRNFRFDVFVEYLEQSHKKFVMKTLKRLDKEISDYKYLHIFYTDAHSYFLNDYPTLNDYEKRVQLQSLLTDTKYPWNAMVDVIQNQKVCMEKLF